MAKRAKDEAPVFSKKAPQLLERHLDHLLGSGISLEVIMERGYRTVLKTIVDKESPVPGEVCLAQYGFKQMQLNVPGILIPLYGVDGAVVLHQLRPDVPRENQDHKPIKYETPQNRNLRLDIPPRCQKSISDPGTPLFITEGAKKADALATVGACSVNLLGVWGWRGTNDKGGKVILADFDYIAFNGRLIYICFDSDIIEKPNVKLAMERLAGVLKNKGADVKVVHLPPGPDNAKTGADDFLARGGKLDDIIRLAKDPAEPVQDPSKPARRRLPFSGNYTIKDGCHCRLQYNPKTEDYDTLPICSFTAEITDEYVTDNGQELQRWIRIAGKTCTGHPLPAIDIEGSKFDSMNWLTDRWGTDAALVPGNMNREHVRSAILANSPVILMKHKYTHTGWLEQDGERIFLTEGGAIGPVSVMVEQDPRLKDYRIGRPEMDAATAFRGSLEFLDVSRRESTVPLWAAMYLAPLSSVIEPNFTLWCTGPSGTFKSTISALALCHFGNFNYKRLPTSWDTTANRLEYLLFLAADVPIVIDDYAPAPDINSQRQLDGLVNRIVRNVGNRQTRGRLHSAGVAQKDYYPRALLISSGEQLPGGHSISARYFQIPFSSKSWVNLSMLSKEQSNTTTYRGAMFYYLEWLRSNWKDLTGELVKQWEYFRNRAREEAPDGMHSRLPEEVATIYIGLLTGMRAAIAHGGITQDEADAVLVDGWRILKQISAEQGRQVELERPAVKFVEGLRSLLSSRKAILRDKSETSTAVPPPGQTLVGWTDNIKHPEVAYLIPGAAYNAVRDYYSHSGQAMTVNLRAVLEDMLRQGYMDFSQSSNSEHRTTTVIRLGSGSFERVVCIKRNLVDEQVATLLNDMEEV